MAHQFSPSSGFGAGYPVPPFYPPSFVQNVSQQMPNLQQGYAQSNSLHSNTHTPNSRSNNMRFDANTHINPQPTPLPFPPSLNPDMFKHFPPPPPPPSNFSAGPGTPTNFQQFPPAQNHVSQSYMHHNFPTLPQTHPSMNGTFSPSVSVGPPVPPHNAQYMQGFHGTESNAVQNARFGNSSGAQHPAAHPTVQEKGNNSSIPAQLDGASHSVLESRHDTNETFPQKFAMQGSDEAWAIKTPITLTKFPNGTSRHMKTLSPNPRLQPDEQNSRPNLMENAKAAILSLVPHKITYNDLLAEGVDAHVLQKLYTDLGLSWKPSEEHVDQASKNDTPVNKENTKQPVQSANATHSDGASQLSMINTSANSSARPAPGPANATRVNPPVSSGLERKDRIAQLLAAKTGKVAMLANASQTGSPASRAESITSQPLLSRTATPTNISAEVSASTSDKSAIPIAQTEVVRQKMEQLRKETADRTKAAEKLQDSSVVVPVERSLIEAAQSQFASLSTPIRESLVQGGLSSMIPGLFMSADDEPADDDTAVIATANVADMQESSLPDKQHYQAGQPCSPSRPNGSLKRSAISDLPDDEARDIKRVASSRAASMGPEMDIDGPGDAAVSDGEIVEEDITTQHEVPHLTHANVESVDAAPQGSPTTAQTSRNGHLFNQYPVPKPDTQDNRTSARSMTEFAPRRAVDTAPGMSDIKTQELLDSVSSSSPITTAPVQIPQKNMLPSPSDAQRLEVSGINERPLISPKPITKLTPTQFAERAAQLKADYIRQRSLRQKQLVDGMPALNDEVVKTQQKLEQHRIKLAELRAEIEKHQAVIARTREVESHIQGEIAHLEKQLQDGVSGQKEFSKELREIKQQAEEDTASPSAVDEHRPIQVQPMSARQSPGLAPQQDPSPKTTDTVLTNTNRSLEEPADGASQHDVSPQNTTADVSMTNSEDDYPQPHTEQYSADANEEVLEMQIISDQVQDINKINATTSYDQLGVITPQNVQEDEEEDGEDDEPMDQSDDELDDTRMSVDQESDDSDGSASMSDSGSDNYEPPEANLQNSLDHQLANSDDYEPSDNLQTPDHAIPIDPVDKYEPSDAVELVDTNMQQFAEAPSATTAQKAEVSYHPQDKTTAAVSQVAQGSSTDDQENGLQLSEANTLTKPQETANGIEPDIPVLPGDETPSFPRFVPYQSPLSSFKSYRFHPSFPEQVKNGYRSLTYSNKIDPKKPICPAELAGEACTDPECEEQHFGSMVLPDDKILVQMSSAIDIKDKTLRDQYLLGLKQVIARLRQEGVKEFPLVADALATYRRAWTTGQTGL